ncbi:poly(U)-specific 3'-to-5' RNA exonuclease [Coemansia spiralis]|uniref:U6 snRNA phosphodiesterase 1 n=1 Tax=Coemansia spiralis TaxID=417178 RepID=A0A9W8GCL6_9FUNG|nr:poly(U)-specific 3'-to-5' RNA exonuclease [Coemansia spiralis]
MDRFDLDAEVEVESGGREGSIDMGHVVGGWAGHVYLAVKGSEGLRRISQACIEAICHGLDDAGTGKAETQCSRNEETMEEKHAGAIGADKGCSSAQEITERHHVSLTRLFYLQEHEISAFVGALERALAGSGPIVVAFGKASVYMSETGERAFIGLDIDYGEDAVREMARVVDGVMRRFGKREFFAEPRFHVSIVRVARTEEMRAQAADRILGQAMHEMIVGLPAVQVDQVECVFGNKRFCISL